MGMTKRRQKNLEATAYHEAGHAIAHYVKKLALRRISIIPYKEDGTEGRCSGARLPINECGDLSYSTARQRTRIEHHIIAFLSGGIAERRFTGRANRLGARGDYDSAVQLAIALSGSVNEAEAYVRYLGFQADGLITDVINWAAVQALATALLAAQEISGRQARKIIKTAQLEYIAQRFATVESITEARRIERR